jgi:WD40 repeat protein
MMGYPATSFSPDGKMLASGGGTGAVKVWDTATGKFLWQTPRHELHYHYPMFTPNGRWLAVFDGQSIRLLDPMSGRERKLFPPEGEQRPLPADAYLLACSPDSHYLATFASEEQEKVVYLWDLDAGRLVNRLICRSKGVSQATFARDGRTLITFAYDNKIVRWDVATGNAQEPVELAVPRLQNARLSDDGTLLAVVPWEDGPVQLVDTETGKVRVTLQRDFPRKPYALVFTPDGKTLAANTFESWEKEGWIWLWETGSGKEVRQFRIPPHGGSPSRFAPDGRTLLVWAWGPELQLWNSVSGEQLLKRPAHQKEARSLSFTPDGERLVSAGNDGVRVWKLATSQQVAAWTGHEGGANTVAVLPDGATALTSGDHDGSLRLWDLPSGQQRRHCQVDNPPLGPMQTTHSIVRFDLAADGRTALSISHSELTDWLLQLWDLTTGKEVLRRSPDFDCFQLHSSTDLKMSLRYASQGGELAFIPPGQAVVEEIATGRQLLSVQQPDYPSYLLFSPDGHTIVTATSHFTRKPAGGDLAHNHALHVWEMLTGRERLAILPAETSGSQYVIQRMAITPNGRTLAAARDDCSILVWDLAAGKELLRLGPADSAVTCLAFSPDQRYLATSHLDSTILLWDISTATQRRRSADPATPQQLESWWADLASDDARKAHFAIWSLASVPDQATNFLRGRLVPAQPAPAEKVRQWLINLDADQFQIREMAAKELAALEELSEPALEAALQAKPTLEKRRRIENLLNALRIVRSPEKLRHLRAIEALEHCGAAAVTVLIPLAGGVAESRVTEAARAALQRHSRLAKRTMP